MNGWRENFASKQAIAASIGATRIDNPMRRVPSHPNSLCSVRQPFDHSNQSLRTPPTQNTFSTAQLCPAVVLL